MALEQSEITDDYAVYNGDCVEIIPSIIKDESIHLSIYSPPFADLYNYSSSERDMSNCSSYEQFLKHYMFLIKEIYRVTIKGRLTVVHCTDLGKGGCQLRDFPGDIIRLHEKAGFKFNSRYSVWKEPLRVAIRTRALGLRHGQMVKDAVKCGAAGADYILSFRKDGKNPEPVTHSLGFKEYHGARIVPEKLIKKYKKWKDPKTNKLFGMT